jgi:hypothetical protein
MNRLSAIREIRNRLRQGDYSIGSWMQSVHGMNDFGHLGDLIGHAGEPSRREGVRAA